MVSPLMSELERVRRRIADAPALLLGLDFDGTLTPIAEHPDDVHLAESTRELLQRLSACPRVRVAVVSGRRLADLEARVAVPGLIYSGNHGLEIAGRGLTFVEPTAAACRPDLAAVAKALAGKLRAIDGAWLEDKGLTLSAHFRRVPPEHVEEVRQLVHSTLAGATHPFVLTAGDKVFDIRPRVYWNKGTAVDWVRKRLEAPRPLVIYFGDDATDEDAFAALPEDITVRVGAPAATAAQHLLDSPADVVRFLDWLSRLLA